MYAYVNISEAVGQFCFFIWETERIRGKLFWGQTFVLNFNKSDQQVHSFMENPKYLVLQLLYFSAFKTSFSRNCFNCREKRTQQHIRNTAVQTQCVVRIFQLCSYVRFCLHKMLLLENGPLEPEKYRIYNVDCYEFFLDTLNLLVCSVKVVTINTG